jgi:hypothetical protein
MDCKIEFIRVIKEPAPRMMPTQETRKDKTPRINPMIVRANQRLASRVALV